MLLCLCKRHFLDFYSLVVVFVVDILCVCSADNSKTFLNSYFM